VTVVPDGTDTGKGVLTMDATTPVVAGAQPGVYVSKCTVPAVNGGTFQVFDPHGVSIGTIAVGATFATQVKFVIADGAPDFAVGRQSDEHED
jgi:hypothetical protein